MRVAPIALFAHKNRKEAIEFAKIQATITHTHPDGVNGAILQVKKIFLRTMNCGILTPMRNTSELQNVNFAFDFT